MRWLVFQINWGALFIRQVPLSVGEVEMPGLVWPGPHRQGVWKGKHLCVRAQGAHDDLEARTLWEASFLLSRTQIFPFLPGFLIFTTVTKEEKVLFSLVKHSCTSGIISMSYRLSCCKPRSHIHPYQSIPARWKQHQTCRSETLPTSFILFTPSLDQIPLESSFLLEWRRNMESLNIVHNWL